MQKLAILWGQFATSSIFSSMIRPIIFKVSEIKNWNIAANWWSLIICDICYFNLELSLLIVWADNSTDYKSLTACSGGLPARQLIMQIKYHWSSSLSLQVQPEHLRQCNYPQGVSYRSTAWLAITYSFSTSEIWTKKGKSIVQLN